MSKSANSGRHVAGDPATESAEAIFSRFDPHVFRRLAGFLRPHRRLLAAAIASLMCFVAVQIGIPASIRYVIDGAVGGAAGRIDAALQVFLALIALNAVLNFLQEWLASRLAQRVIFDLRRAMFVHLQKVSLSVLDQTQVGRLMSRLQGDVNALQEFMENSISSLGDLVLLLGIIGVLLAMSVKLGLLTLTVLPALALARVLWIPWARRAFVRAREASSSVNAALAENISGIRTVQENRRERVNLLRYEARARDYLDAQIASSRASQVMVPAVDILTGLAMAIVVAVGGLAVLSGEIGIGVVVAYIFYVQRFFDPIRTLSMQYTVMQRAMAAGHRIFEVLDIPLTLVDKPVTASIGAAPPTVELQDVVFGYRPGLPVLHDVDLRIEAYQTVALIGPTGSGKTSIAALVHRFYDTWQGSVRIAGYDVRDLSQDELGRTVGMVLQEPFLFSGSIADNIGYGVAHATRADVIEAAKAVRAHAFITQLPDGYDTLLGQRGRNLSIGQRQLLSFARALLSNPRILILDEATANIDSFTEQEIQQALNVLRHGRTTIIIAHRLATVRDADNIIVLNRGRIAEQGRHRALLELGGLYARLHASGLSTFDAEERA